MNNQLLGQCISVSLAVVHRPSQHQSLQERGCRALLPDARTSLPLSPSPSPRQLLPSPASLRFLHPFHKVSGKKDHCFLEKGPVGKERRCRQQHLATLWLGARTRSYEIDTSNNFYFRFATLSGYMKIKPVDPNYEDLPQESRAPNALLFPRTQNPHSRRGCLCSWLFAGFTVRKVRISSD